MLRRFTWASAGLVVGFGASKWLEHEAKKRLRRHLPKGLPELRERFAGAAEEGRRVMEAREAELRAQLLHKPGP